MDTLRLEIVSAGEVAGGGFALEMWVNEVEMTEGAAGLGMDPYDVLVPTNRLLPGDTPRTVPVARCGCGNYGCSETDVEVTRTPTSVRWLWLKDKPGRDISEFDLARYVEEVTRSPPITRGRRRSERRAVWYWSGSIAPDSASS